MRVSLVEKGGIPVSPIARRSVVYGVRITLVLLVGLFIVSFTGLADTVAGRLVGWLFGWPVRPFIRFIPRFDDPPLIGIVITLVADLLVYSTLSYVALRLAASISDRADIKPAHKTPRVK